LGEIEKIMERLKVRISRLIYEVCEENCGLRKKRENGAKKAEFALKSFRTLFCAKRM
jgi:hypothetical protein